MSRELFDAVSVRGHAPSARGLSPSGQTLSPTDVSSSPSSPPSFLPSPSLYLLSSVFICSVVVLVFFVVFLGFSYRIWIGARARASARSDSAVSVGRVSHFNPKPFPFLFGSTSGKNSKTKGPEAVIGLHVDDLQ